MKKLALCLFLVFFLVSCERHKPYPLRDVQGLEDCIAIYAPHPVAATVVRCKNSAVTTIIKTKTTLDL